MRLSPTVALAVGLAVIAALATAPAGNAGRAFASVNACSLFTAAQAGKILGYKVRLRKGETVEDCTIVATPIRLDPETLHPRHPTIILEVDPTRPGLFAKLTRKGKPVAGLGSRAAIVYSTTGNPALDATYFLCAEVGRTLLQLSVGVATVPISHAQGVKLAKLVASRL